MIHYQASKKYLLVAYPRTNTLRCRNSVYSSYKREGGGKTMISNKLVGFFTYIYKHYNDLVVENSEKFKSEPHAYSVP